MFDASTPAADAAPIQPATPVANADAAPDWRAALKAGDIVAFRFPVEDASDPKALPNVRPALVMSCDRTGEGVAVTLAFGTSRGAVRFHDYPYDHRYGVGVWSIAEIKAANLHRAIGFACERRITVSPDDPRFASSKRGTPVIGTLGARPFERLRAVIARITAERDIAAGRGPKRPEVSTAPVRTVEVTRRRKGERLKLTPPKPTLATSSEVPA